MSPLPSMGWPRASTTRPRKASPTGIPAVFPLRRTVSPARISWLLPKSTQPTLSRRRSCTMPLMPPGKSRISP